MWYIVLGIIGILIGAGMLGSSRTRRLCLILGPWFSIIMFIKFLSLFILYNLIATSGTVTNITVFLIV